MAIIDRYTGKPLDPEWMHQGIIVATTPTHEDINLLKRKKEEIEKRYVNVPVTILDNKYKMDPSIEAKYSLDKKKSVFIHSKPDWDDETRVFLIEYKKNRYNQGTNADEYFERFRLKYINSDYSDPYYEIQIYLELLKQLKKKITENKFEVIHKGSPYFYIGFNYLLLKNFEDAMYYLDMAVAEDIKNHGKTMALTSGAASFFLLDSKFDTPFKNYYYSTLEDIITRELNRFNQNKSDKLELDDFKKFIQKMILQKNTTIVTTLYTFILEKESIIDMINVGSLHGGTIEPMVSHLWKGASLFETLLKHYHSQMLSQIYIKKSMEKKKKKSVKKSLNTLGGILDKKEICKIYDYKFENCQSSSLKEIFEYANNHDKESIKTAFHVTCRIRNTTGHKLNWPEVFNTTNYENVFELILNALIFVIQKNKKTS